MGVMHYFSNAKAEKHLGYRPTKQNDVASATEWFINRGYKKEEKRPPNILYAILLNVLLASITVAVVMSFLPLVM